MKLLPAPRSNRSGVTLTELLTIVIIIGILAGLSIQQLSRMIERGQRREAIDLLNTIYSGERAYYFTKSKTVPPSYYGPLDVGKTNEDWGNIFMDDPNDGSSPVAFSIVATPSGTGVPSSFTATATSPRGNMQVKVQGDTVSWCGAAGGRPVPINMRGDTCDSASWWAFP